MIRRFPLGVLLLLLAVIACGPLGSSPSAAEPSSTPSPIPPTASPTEDPFAGWLLYTNADCAFEIRVPPGSNITPGSDSDMISLPITPGTNLQEKTLTVTCAQGATACISPFAAGYAPGALPVETKEFDGGTFAIVTAAEGAAGHFYAWRAYSTAAGSFCADLSFLLQSVNPELYSPPLLEYNHAAESAIFEEIVNTFHW